MRFKAQKVHPTSLLLSLRASVGTKVTFRLAKLYSQFSEPILPRHTHLVNTGHLKRIEIAKTYHQINSNMNRHQQYPYPELKPTSSQNTGDDDSADEIEVVHTVHNNSAAKAVHNTDNVNSTLASFCWNKACVRCILPLFIICGITYGVIAALGIHVDKNSIPFSDFIFSRDGWEGLKAEDLPRWNNRGSGILQVEMLNALDDHWQSYFNKSFDEWNSGEPSVLELSVTKVEPDSGCDFVGGKFA